MIRVYHLYCNQRNSFLSLKQNIQQVKNESIAIQDELKAILQRRDTSISELKTMNSEANEKIITLEKALVQEKALFHEYRSDTKKEIEMNQIKEENRKAQDEAIKNELHQRIDFFMIITSSYIQGLYDQCLAQEQLMLVEDPTFRPAISRQRLKGGNTKNLNLILEQLNNKIESIHINWEGMLQNDDDRRVIFGNLNNRSQLNLSYIDDLIKKIHIKYTSEVARIESDHGSSLDQLVSRHRNEKSKLLMQIASKNDNYTGLENTFHEKSKKLSDTISDNDKLHEMLKEREAYIVEQDNQMSDFQRNEVTLQNEISSVRIFKLIVTAI